MSHPGILRFLEVVCRTLGAADARLEIGGRDPDAPELVWQNVAEVGRVVAVFDAPVANHETAAEQLRALVTTFETSLASQSAQLPQPPSAELAARRLDAALLDLAERVSASVVAVIDETSPVIWGRSDGGPERHIEDLVAARRLGSLDERRTLLARALEQAHRRGGVGANETIRHHEPDLGWLMRPFAGVYRLVLVFPGEFSELVAEGHALHAVDHVERLVMALPPVDPPPGGARVMRFPVR